MNKLVLKLVVISLVLVFFRSFDLLAQTGASLSTAVDMGGYSACGSPTFIDARNSTNYNGTTYTNSMGQPSPEVYYKFTVVGTITMDFSLCGSSFDTYIHVLNSSGTVITYQDDSPDCGTKSHLSYNLGSGTYYLVVEGYANYTGAIGMIVSAASTGSSTPGSNISTAINAGTFSVSGSYSDTRSNFNACLNNDIGQPNDDIFYKITLTANATVTISHCGSEFDTYMHLLDASGNTITYNDDSSVGPCPGGQAYIQTSLSPGTYYVVSEGYGTYTGSIVTAISVSITSSSGPPVISYIPNSSMLNVGAPVSLTPVNTGGAVTSGDQTTYTLAGSGSSGFTNGTGTSATFYLPTSVVTDAAGNVYVGDSENNVIRKISPAGVVTTFAGSGAAGASDGTGTSATFKHPAGLTIDASGNLFVADQYNHKIRKITPGGVVTTFAGSGTAGASNGTGTGASFNNPTGLVFDSSGNLFVCDYSNHIIRKITSGAVVTTFAGNGAAGYNNATGTSASFNGPIGIGVDLSNNLYIADRLNYRVRKISPAAVVTTFAGSGISGSSNGSATVASFNRPTGIALDVAGNLYVTDENNHQIRKIAPDGTVSALAGAAGVAGTVNGTGAVVRFYSPYAIAIDNQGVLYVAQLLNHVIRKIVVPKGYSISPSLSAGLSFNAENGNISGVPTVTSPATTYTITATNGSGSGITTLTLQVVAGSGTNINSLYSKDYDEDGVLISEVKTYFNSDGKPLQSQVKNLSTNQVLATEVLYDALGRSVGSTLAAPINSSVFGYKEKFVTDNSGLKYNFNNFDLLKTNAPDPVNGNTPGTLGWYYSNNNTVEPYVPATSYPYNRHTFYGDGTGGVKKNSNIGEIHKMGSGFQSSENSLGVLNELNFYSQLRNKFFPESVVGARYALKGNAMLHVAQDENGLQQASITDLEGHVLMTAKAGGSGGLAVIDTVSISNQSGYEYLINWNDGGVSPSFTPYIRINGGLIDVYKSTNNWATSTVVYSGSAVNYNFTGSTQGNYKIICSTPFDVSFQVPINATQTEKCKNCSAQIGAEGKKEVYYFRLYGNTNVNIMGTGWKLYNMSADEQEIVAAGPVIALAQGYYKVSIPLSGSAIISYSSMYSDISYNFFNQLGQLVGTVAPEGVKAINTNGLGSYPTFISVPFVRTYEYDIQGNVAALTSTDGGRTEFIYRKDGKIRFAQNSLQRGASPKAFSYHNYDKWGRSVESGEFTESGGNTFVNLRTNASVQENTNSDGGLVGTKTQWIKTHYGESDNSHGLTGYLQNEIVFQGLLSWTENAAGSKTWYNYDHEGRVIWMIKYIPGLGAKSVDYGYDAKGNTKKVDYQKNVSSEQYAHEYDYDVDNRLKAVYTSTTTYGRKEQARYFYYMHGPLKRIQLANDLQGIDYVYTAQGNLKSINHPLLASDPGKDGIANLNSPDAFGITLEYFNGDYSRSGTGISSLITGGTASYNGNIMGQSWRSKKPNVVVATFGATVNNPAMVTYEYDSKYQFNSNKYGTPNFGTNAFTETVNANKEYDLSYDANGNIKALKRNNATGANTANYIYNYIPNSNKLSSVSNYSASYSYNVLGQMNAQIRAGGAGYYLNYNLNGRVTAVYSDVAKTILRVSFGYDEFGNRIRKTDHVLNTITYYVYDDLGNVLSVYDNKNTPMQQKELPIYAATRLGTYYKQSNGYQYELTDHIGNVRAVINGVKQVDGQADVVYYSDYYPFGSPLSLANSDYRYGYQGQYAEVDKETGWNNFDFRMYDAQIGRWMSTDPAGQYYSPYVGMGNNPIAGVDPDGAYTWLGAKLHQIGAFVTGKNPGSLFKSGDEWGFTINSGPENLGYTTDFGARNKSGKNSWDLDNNGKLWIGEANRYYRNGGSKPLHVKASSVDLSSVDPDIFRGQPINSTKSVKLLWSNFFGDGVVYGELSLKNEGGNKVSILPNKYDFDIGADVGHPWFKTRSGFIRNLATFTGSVVATGMGKDKGYAYEIVFDGTATLKRSSN